MDQKDLKLQIVWNKIFELKKTEYEDEPVELSDELYNELYIAILEALENNSKLKETIKEDEHYHNKVVTNLKAKWYDVWHELQELKEECRENTR